MSTERVVVQALVKEHFLEKLVAKAKALGVEGIPPIGPRNWAPVIDESAAERVKALVDDAIRARRCAALRRRTAGGLLPPTVLDKSFSIEMRHLPRRIVWASS